jgi:hypothetical protein
MRLILQIFPNNFLEKYNEISRLRLENKLIDSIRNGRFVPKKNYCQSGAFGTWAGSRYEYFILKDDLIDAILDNLSSTDEHKQDYIFRYFFHCLPKLVNPPDYRIEAVIYDGLKAGNKKFYDALKYKDKKWRKPFQEAYDNFREAEPEYDDDNFLDLGNIKMKYATIVSVLIFVLGINSAVFLHHSYVEKEMEKKHSNEIELKPKSKTIPYQFHYAGQEKWSNVFALYRLNKETGEILRFSYTIFEKSKDGHPAYDKVEALNMATGECIGNTSSDDELILKLYYKNLFEDNKKKPKKKP